MKKFYTELGMEVKETITNTPEGGEVEEITAAGGPGDWIETAEDNICIGATGYRTDVTASGECAHIATSGEETVIEAKGKDALIATAGRVGDQVVSSGGYATIACAGGLAVVESTADGATIATAGHMTRVDSTGSNAVIGCLGNGAGARGQVGSWITLAEWAFDKQAMRSHPVCVKTEFVDGERIKAGVYYRLVNGKFTEAEEDDFC